jgi:hypothetical protein
MAVLHDFEVNLAWSEAAGYEPFWDAVYRKAFPNLLNHMQCNGDTASQRMGIDRLILLSNGRTLYVDEKKRREVYTDVLLEYISVDRTGAPGWMEKDLSIDFLAYAFIPNRECYLFPWNMLRRAWLQFGERWKQRYQKVTAKNDGYYTVSVAVPIQVLQRAVCTAAVIRVESDLSGWEPPTEY